MYDLIGVNNICQCVITKKMLICHRNNTMYMSATEFQYVTMI